MDEPTVGLDPVARHGVWDLVRNLRERFGATVLITTHLMDEAEALCDRIGVLHAGVLVHRFRNSNHFRRLGRAYRTKCGRRGLD